MPVNTVFFLKSFFTYKGVLLFHSLPDSFAVKFVSLQYKNIFILQTSVEINCWRADSFEFQRWKQLHSCGFVS